MKPCFIVGTKAELIKTMPVMLELQSRGIDYFFIHTGQHNISDAVQEFSLKDPDIVLYEPPNSSSKFMTKTHKAVFWSLPMVFKVRKALRSVGGLDFVFYHGDTMSTAIASLASSKLLNWKKSWKNVHLEAGLRSGNLFEPFPEEISRRVADMFSDVLFAPSELSVKNLGKRDGVVNVGNTVIDGSLLSLNLANKRFGALNKKDFVLVNVHRHENIKSKARLGKIVDIVCSVSGEVLWPLHDNTRRQLLKFGLLKKIKKQRNIHITKLLSYLEFVQLIANSKFILTDGGSIQEESLGFRKPCIILRLKTERPEGLDTGINFLTKLDVDYSKELIKKLESSFVVPEFVNPYGNGTASKQIVDYLMGVNK